MSWCTAATEIAIAAAEMAAQLARRADLHDRGQISPAVNCGEVTPDQCDLDPREISLAGTPVPSSMYATLSKPVVIDTVLPAKLPLVVPAAVSMEASTAIRDLMALLDAGLGQQEAAVGMVKTLACMSLQLACAEDAGRVSALVPARDGGHLICTP